MSETFAEIGNRADLVRNIELEAVLQRTGCTAHTSDKNKWHTPQGVISVTGAKFINWSKGIGGGGAIDLVLHLTGCDFKTAVRWLSDTLPQISRKIRPDSNSVLSLPTRNDANLSRVMNYLKHDRCLPTELLDSLVQSGTLYADDRANAVFLLLGKDKVIVGAELRGTTRRCWHGMCPGSRKDLGCFHIQISATKKVVLCESAIDAISCLALQDCIAVSTSGAHADPAWLPALIRRGFHLHCGFDSDPTGDSLARRMLQIHPGVRRLRPSKHDWNEQLQSLFS